MKQTSKSASKGNKKVVKASTKPIKKTVEQVQQAAPVEVAKVAEQVKPVVQKPSEGDRIWAEIKNVQVSLFALPAKPLSSYCKQIQLDPKQCFLTFDARQASVIPAMEAVLAPKFDIQMLDNRYIVVSRKPLP
jgi:hypothetical protein